VNQNKLTKNDVVMPRELKDGELAKGLLCHGFYEEFLADCDMCESEGVLHFEGVPEDCLACGGNGAVKIAIPVKWDTIKDIYSACVELLGREC